MQTAINIVGTAVIIMLIGYAALHFYYKAARKEKPAQFNLRKMPVLRPIPIPTKGRGTFMKFLIMIYEVRRWELEQNWYYDHTYNGETVRIVLPKGFRFDGASIPRPFWALLSPVGLLLIPGLIHDYGYRHQQLWQIDNHGEVIPWAKGEDQKFWDKQFLNVGKQVNGFALIDAIAYLALSIAGSSAWKSNRRRDEPITRPEI